MEIKKGISQMSEYPNVEIDYVVPKSGNMYYILKDGQLANGSLIATLDPRHAIDEANGCSTVGAFFENGDTLIDFDKENISKITDNLLLAVNSTPITQEVISAINNKDIPEENNKLLEEVKEIEKSLLEEMGPSGEIIFSNPYKEANVYTTDSYNNKVGIDCSIIGKNDTGLYFHTNNISSPSKFIKVDEFKKEEEILEHNELEAKEEVEEKNQEEDNSLVDGFKISDEELNNISFEDVDKMINDGTEKIEENKEDAIADIPLQEASESVENQEENAEEDTNLSIENQSEEEVSVNIKNEDYKEKEEIIENIDNNSNIEEVADEEEQKEKSIDEDISETEEKNEVFDNAIELINKYMDQANRLNERIKELEDQAKEHEKTIENQKREISENEERIKKQEKILNEQANKKDELNNLLSKANEVLENIK